MFVTEQQIETIATKIDLLAEEVIRLRSFLLEPPVEKEVYSIQEIKQKFGIKNQSLWNTERFNLIQAGMVRIGHNYRISNEVWERYYFNKRKTQN